MGGRSLLILSAIVALLGAFIFFFEKDLPSTEERTQLAKQVIDLEADDVLRVTLEREGTRVRLERDPAPEPGEKQKAEAEDADAASPATAARPWRLTEPLTARADKDAVDRLVSALAKLEKSRTIAGISSADAGLEPPRAKVTLERSQGQTVLTIGAEVPAAHAMLVGVQGRAEVYQVADSLWSDLSKAPGEWRDRKLFGGFRGDITQVSWNAGAGQIVLAQQGGEDFWLTSPVRDRADAMAVNSLLSELVNLEAQAFLDDPAVPLVSLGLDPPQVTLVVERKGEQPPFRLELGSVAGGGHNVRVGEQRSIVKSELPATLSKPAAEWRSRAWTALQVFKIDQVEIKDAVGSLHLTRADADWKRGEERIAYSTVSDFLYALTDVKADLVVSREEAGAQGHPLSGAQLSLTLQGQEGAKEQLTLYPTVGALAAATSSDREAVLLVPAAAAEKLVSQLTAVRQAPPVTAEASKAQAATEKGPG